MHKTFNSVLGQLVYDGKQYASLLKSRIGARANADGRREAKSHDDSISAVLGVKTPVDRAWTLIADVRGASSSITVISFSKIDITVDISTHTRLELFL